jgi:hypothetical protein
MEIAQPAVKVQAKGREPLGIGSRFFRSPCQARVSKPVKPVSKPVSGFGCLLIVLDSCEGAAMARSISTGVFTFHEPALEGGIVGDEASERADTKQH